MLPTKNAFQTLRHIQTESERVEKYIPCKWEAKESWNSNPHFIKIGLKIKNVTRDNDGHYIMIKGSIQEEDIAIVNIHAPNRGAPQYIRQTLTDLKRVVVLLTVAQ